MASLLCQLNIQARSFFFLPPIPSSVSTRKQSDFRGPNVEWRVMWWGSQEVGLVAWSRARVCVCMCVCLANMSPGVWRWTCVCYPAFLQSELQLNDNEVNICGDMSLRHMYTHASFSRRAPVSHSVSDYDTVGSNIWTRLFPAKEGEYTLTNRSQNGCV